MGAFRWWNWKLRPCGHREVILIMPTLTVSHGQKQYLHWSSPPPHWSVTRTCHAGFWGFCFHKFIIYYLLIIFFSLHFSFLCVVGSCLWVLVGKGFLCLFLSFSFLSADYIILFYFIFLLCNLKFYWIFKIFLNGKNGDHFWIFFSPQVNLGFRLWLVVHVVFIQDGDIKGQPRNSMNSNQFLLGQCWPRQGKRICLEKGH